MRKLILTGIAALVLAAPASAAPTRLVVAMHDPGCHWFSVGAPDHARYVKTVTHTGPVTLVNLDQATLVIKGPGGTHLDKVGANLPLATKGVYRITMVHQASDDNHLKLTIR